MLSTRSPRLLSGGARLLAALLAVAGSAAGCDCGPGVRDAHPLLKVDPEEIVFADVAVGSADGQLVEVRNDGKGDLLVTSVALAQPSEELNVTRVFTTDCQGGPRGGTEAELGTIVAGGCARFEVRYVPKAKGPLANKVVLLSNDPDPDRAALEIPIRGSAVSPGIKVCLVEGDGSVKEENCARPQATPPVIPEIDFGPVPLTDKEERKVRVFNEGDGPLQITAATVESEWEDFALVPGPFTGKIEAGKSEDLVVKFEPLGDGPMTGTLVIPSNDLQHPKVEIPLKAEAKGPRLCITPAEGLDFGAIPVGQTRKLSLTLNNCSQVPYDITQLDFVEDDATTLEYTIAGGIPARPLDFPPGKQMVLDVTYAPKTVASASSAGDTAGFLIKTGPKAGGASYQSGRVPVRGKGANPGCDGQQPTADIKVLYNGTVINPATRNIEPLEQVTLDGSGSTVPGTTSPVYQWRVVSQPPNGTVGISGAGVRPKLYLELVGDYVVELVVKNQYGCASAPKQVTIHSVPQGKLHLQLTWPESYGDLDLHYIGPGGAFYQTGRSGPAGDVFYANKRPDWGSNNTVNPDGNPNNNPSLDIDKLWGNGPENVTHDLPFDGTYKVMVHYYCSRQFRNGGYSSVSSGQATANLKVFVNGVKQAEISKALRQRDVWEAALITVSGGGSQFTVTPSTAAVTRSYWGGAYDPASQSCTGDTN